jgi:thiol-disulfide isomerase/thioredoxin
MRWITPRPILLALTLVLVIGAIAAIELRLDRAPGADAAGTQAKADKQPQGGPQSAGKAKGETRASGEAREKLASGYSDDTRRSSPPQRDKGENPEQTVSDAERIANKEDEYQRAREIMGSTGLINTNGISIKDAAGEKVVLVEFWTYTCFNCQNAQPHINALYEKYRDDDLQVIGVHTPEFGFEKDISNVREAVGQANIEYPVVLDNHYAIWSDYGQRFWPAWYLIDADGFIRYKHFGEGAYEETDQKVQELLAERDRVYQ